MDHGLAVRCGHCQGTGRFGGFFRRCARCAGRGFFDPVTAPAGLGTLVAACDALRTGSAIGLLVRPALPWERFPIPDELKGHPGTPDESTWERALRSSAVVLYEHADGKARLASGLELERLPEAFQVLREVSWVREVDGGLLRCFDRDLAEVELRLAFFRAWRGEWLEITRATPHAATSRPPPITGAAQRYITGKYFVGVPSDDPPIAPTVDPKKKDPTT